MSRSFIKRATALILAAAMLAVAGCNYKNDPAAQNKAAIALANYPDRPKYPVSDNGLDYDEKAYDAWRKSDIDRRLEGAELDKMSGVWAKLLPALLGGSDENIVCSPANLYVALSMLAECAGGESREQILSVLGSGSMRGQRALTKRLWEALYNDDGTYKGLLANSLWLRAADSGEYEKAVLDTLARDYYASSFAGEMGSDEFDAVLRDWLNGQTGGLLQKELEGLKLRDNTVMAIASTAYFNDAWSAKFDPDMTSPDTFHALSGDVERDFMRETTRSLYYWGEDFAGVALYFRTGGSMRLLLPDEGADIDEVLSDSAALDFLTRDRIPESVERRELEIHLSLPKFDVTSNGDIKDRLSAVGVTDVFDPEASDFRPLIGEDNMFSAAGEPEPWRVWVSEVLHGARVRADEKGGEAAAYTLVIMEGAGAAEPTEVEEIELTFDRPFLFSLMSGGVPMFAGAVYEP